MVRASAAVAAWHPTLGACVEPSGVRFRVWAPAAKTIEVLIPRSNGVAFKCPLQAEPHGYFSALVQEAQAGDLYRYRVNDENAFPDPAAMGSRTTCAGS